MLWTRMRALAASAALLGCAAPAAAQDPAQEEKPAPAAAQEEKAAPAAAQEEKAAPAAAQEEKAAPARQPGQPAARDPFALLPAARPADVASADAIVAALYSVISGDAGVERDWDRFRSLFYPGARMIPTGKHAATGKINARIASPEEYIRASESFLEGRGFHEQEISRHADAFGNIVHVFSSYEARHKLSDEKPFLRGINSIQLFNDGKRWWIMTVAWSPESPESPLPKEYSARPAA